MLEHENLVLHWFEKWFIIHKIKKMRSLKYSTRCSSAQNFTSNDVLLTGNIQVMLTVSLLRISIVQFKLNCSPSVPYNPVADCTSGTWSTWLKKNYIFDSERNTTPSRYVKKKLTCDFEKNCFWSTFIVRVSWTSELHSVNFSNINKSYYESYSWIVCMRLGAYLQVGNFNLVREICKLFLMVKDIAQLAAEYKKNWLIHWDPIFSAWNFLCKIERHCNFVFRIKFVGDLTSSPCDLRCNALGCHAGRLSLSFDSELNLTRFHCCSTIYQVL